MLEKVKVELKSKNKELKGQVESLEVTIAKNKALVDDAEALLGHNLDLRVDLRKRDMDLKEAKDSQEKGRGGS